MFSLWSAASSSANTTDYQVKKDDHKQPPPAIAEIIVRVREMNASRDVATLNAMGSPKQSVMMRLKYPNEFNDTLVTVIEELYKNDLFLKRARLCRDEDDDMWSDDEVAPYWPFWALLGY
jgi:hypothetical protein